MKCPKCHFDNREGAKFCGKCRTALSQVCPNCNSENPPENTFCDECGQELVKETEKTAPEPEGERKHVTVLFSDLSGYTAMSEKLDPEEVKEITSRIFSDISKVVDKYEGFVEKFVGDAVMALFGVPKAHEDDPIRAIKVARKIHELVDSMSPEVEKTVGYPISMHTGINTGLVVTGEVDMEKGTHGVAGDTVNLASRLCSLGKAGEILVGPDTYRQAEGHFTFESLEPARVKGKAEALQVYKVLSPKDRPVTIHRLSGLRADLIGRKAEIAQLREAVGNLRKGRGSVFSICGDAGTGKSRLVEEFKATLDLEEIQWLEGHAYAYAQNIPYFPMIDLLNRVFRIEEGDPPEKVRYKIESGLLDLVEKKDVVPYLGGLYSLSYPELEDVSPELWKFRLQEAVKAILSALAQRELTIFFLEDLHWADASFLELLRQALLEIRHPAIVLCTYRPQLSLFTSHQLAAVSKIYHEIRLRDLSPSEAQDMVVSLLNTDRIPPGLARFVQDKSEGNPFYLEEVINSLIESEALIRDNGTWHLARQISELNISSTIHGVISARVDRLEREAKRILQEASVIGRVFLYNILNMITDMKDQIDVCLSRLERLDLIRTRSFQPDLEYFFKHAFTQQVVYDGLLRRERQEIHERIGLVMEQLFYDRLPEFYETLAFHFKQGLSVTKAVEYLMKAGKKSFSLGAVEEANLCYEEAYNLLAIKPDRTKDEEGLLIDLLLDWSSVFYFRGDFTKLIDLLKPFEANFLSLDDKGKLGLFYAWFGQALSRKEQLKESHAYLNKALKLGEETNNKRVVGVACTGLIWTCADLGLLDDAVGFGKRAKEILNQEKGDPLFALCMGGLGQLYYFRGDIRKLHEIGNICIEEGQKYFDDRMISIGHMYKGWAYLTAGDFSSAIEQFKMLVKTSPDPVRRHSGLLLLGCAYLANEQLTEAEHVFREVMVYSDTYGAQFIGRLSEAFHGLIVMETGKLNEGLRIVENALEALGAAGSRYRYAGIRYSIGRFYLKIVEHAGPKSFSFLAKNIVFLIKTVPVADKKAEYNFNKAIEVALEIGAKSVLGPSYFGLGLLHKAKGRIEKARESITNAIQVFKEIEADVFLKQAQEALASLK